MPRTESSAGLGTGHAVGDVAPSKRRLGRGLGSLIGLPAPVPIAVGMPGSPLDAATAASNATLDESPALHVDSDPEKESGPLVQAIPLGAIVASPFQPRQAFEQGALDALAASIRSAGVMQPIVVRRRPSALGTPAAVGGRANPKASESFEIIAGERRFRAAKQLGLPTIPAIVRVIDDRTAAEWAIIENLQREDLNPIERAAAFQRLVDEFGLSHQEVAEQVGLDRSTIANLLRLNDLDSFTADAVRQGRLSMGHARALLGCTESAARAELAGAAIRGGWSVRKTEQAVAAGGARRRSKSGAIRPASAHVAALERQLGAQLGTRGQHRAGQDQGRGSTRHRVLLARSVRRAARTNGSRRRRASRRVTSAPGARSGTTARRSTVL
jgi:ParB family chromosome partitioning protein